MKTQSVVSIAGMSFGLAMFAPALAVAGNAASLMFPLDASWSVVPFAANGPQGNGPSIGDLLERNDDDYAQAGVGMPSVPFNFNLYGTNYTGSDIFLNNNGNLSFGAGFTSFTSTGFPVAGFPMVAPFWADVDTRNELSGTVYYKFIDGNGDSAVDTLVVTWDNVGYYNSKADKTNTFQVAISDGSNPFMGLGNNICFSYDDMQWTTGDASDGVNGFGGTPATVGVNSGNGFDFFQIGRFDHEGNDYDGSGGLSDGVSFLDNLDLCFSASGFQNQPPIAVGLPENQCYLLDVSSGDSLNALLQFIGPELGDLVTIDSFIDLNNAQAAGLMVGILSPGDPAEITLDWTPDLNDLGTYNFFVNFTDSFGEDSNIRFKIQVVPAPGIMAFAGLSGLLILRRRQIRSL
ncbi:MAG: hypothetical protein JNK58_08345 [Phycisphaerae bacterium]|nr:hypothetical protein [Phycisphaerae bacterium]